MTLGVVRRGGREGTVMGEDGKMERERSQRIKEE